MKKFNKASIIFVSLALGLVLPVSALAATTPSLGAAATYGILSSTYTNTVAGTTVNGDVGFTTGPAVAPAGTHTNYGSGAPYSTAGSAQGSALSALASQACTFTFAPGAINLSTDTTHGPIGVYTPGVYCSTGAMNVGGPLTLSGSGTYVFRPVGALDSTAGAIVSLSGASACDVFWTPSAATTLAANTTFVGTVIDNSGITVGANTTWNGRALAFGGTVTTATDSITKVPSLLALLAAGGGSVAFDYAVSNIGTVAMSNVTVADNKCSPVTFLSGDTNGNLTLEVTETWNYRCTANVSQTTTNTVTATGQANGFTATDTAEATVVVGAALPPPLIHLVKKPSVLLLPASGGAVTYTYTVTNPGTVALNDVSVADNKCSPVSGRSGDVNSNNMLDVSETWVYSCQMNLTQTTTNTGTAQGSANGFTVTDLSLATVVVSAPALPKTGFPPEENTLWNIILPAGILGALFSFYLARKKELI